MRLANVRFSLGLTVLSVGLLAGLAVAQSARAPKPAASQPAGARPPTAPVGRQYTRPSDQDLRGRLSPLQYEVTQQSGTERPFRNAYWNNHEPGIYVDIVTGEPLFSSLDKFDSGTGWPSFTRPLHAEHVRERTDESHGMRRTEVRSGSSHLGHVFDDGPGPGGKRYCINSAALRFVPAARLIDEGYPEYHAMFFPAEAASSAPSPPAPPAPASPTEPARETAILAGGCFWGMEEILRNVPGVIETEVGYTGGRTERPTYDTVHLGNTGHTEAVRVVFDPAQLTYTDLLERWFFRMHDPTTPNRQGNDLGSQYRSAIFYTSEAQRVAAQQVKARVQQSGLWRNRIVTELAPAGAFTPAEASHQDYLQRNPDGYTCHYLR